MEDFPAARNADPSPARAGRDDPALVALLRADGKPRQSAIAQLYGRYGREFKGYFRRHGAGDAAAEDLLQETFIKVLRAIDTWSGAGTLEAWLWTIARNTLLSSLRSESAAPMARTSLDDDDAPAQAEAASLFAAPSGDPADADCVKRGLAAFSARFAEYAHVLERVAIDGWGYDELAQFRGCNAGAAREYLSQCRKRVWQYIGHCYEPRGAGSAA
jgi:RNA polymerase sigma-70 factor (ECF subfamily)